MKTDKFQVNLKKSKKKYRQKNTSAVRAVCTRTLRKTVHFYIFTSFTKNSFFFQVTYQLKILTTALMLKFFLNKRLSGNQWIALVLLIIGVSDVQLQYQPPSSKSGYLQQKPFIGFISVVIMCFTSAFAGVYMEKVLKQSKVDVWMQNIRLALFGLTIAMFSMVYRDFNVILTGKSPQSMFLYIKFCFQMDFSVDLIFKCV